MNWKNRRVKDSIFRRQAASFERLAHRLNDASYVVDSDGIEHGTKRIEWIDAFLSQQFGISSGVEYAVEVEK